MMKRLAQLTTAVSNVFYYMQLIIFLLETFGNRFIRSVNKILELAEGKYSHIHCNSFV